LFKQFLNAFFTAGGIFTFFLLFHQTFHTLFFGHFFFFFIWFFIDRRQLGRTAVE